MTIPHGKELINSGDITNNGTIANNGAITNNGTITNNGAIDGSGDALLDNSGGTYTGTAPTGTTVRYGVTLEVNGGGTVTGGGTYDRGSSATVTATPKTGYSFVS